MLVEAGVVSTDIIWMCKGAPRRERWFDLAFVEANDGEPTTQMTEFAGRDVQIEQTVATAVEGKRQLFLAETQRVLRGFPVGNVA